MALLKEAGAKKSVVTDLGLLLELLRRFNEVSLAEFESRALRSMALFSRNGANHFSGCTLAGSWIWLARGSVQVR
jgi:hypothetical protein